MRAASGGGSCARMRGGGSARRGDLAVGLQGERLHLGLGDVAGDDDDGIVGRVVAVVPGDGVGAGEVRHLVRPADDRDAVVAVLEERGADRFAELGARIVVGAHAALFEDHLALGQERRVVDDEVRHAVGLVFHHQAEMLLGDGLVKDGVVLGGEGVLVAADLIDLGENSPAGWSRVPLNIRCSRKWAMPDLPGGSSAEPALYQTMWVTVGVRWSGMTTTCRPLSRVKVGGRNRGRTGGYGGKRQGSGSPQPA